MKASTGTGHGDYNGHMVKSLREAKAHLSQLVERASRGEDVLISVRGTVKARLTQPACDVAADRRQWVRELEQLQKKYTRRRKPKLTIEQIIDEIREDSI